MPTLPAPTAASSPCPAATWKEPPPGPEYPPTESLSPEILAQVEAEYGRENMPGENGIPPVPGRRN